MGSLWKNKNARNYKSSRFPFLFCKLLESELWKTELAKAASSVLVGLHNNTRLNMERISMSVNGFPDIISNLF